MKISENYLGYIFGSNSNTKLSITLFNLKFKIKVNLSKYGIFANKLRELFIESMSTICKLILSLFFFF